MIKEERRYVTNDGILHKSKEDAEAHIIDSIGIGLNDLFNRALKNSEYVDRFSYIELDSITYNIALEMIGNITKVKETMRLFDIAAGDYETLEERD